MPIRTLIVAATIWSWNGATAAKSLADITFTDINAGLLGTSFYTAAWGDYDNDGDLDILMTGRVDAGTRIYRNDDGLFSDIGAGVVGVGNSAAAWGDYDNDGDLDILLTGRTSTERLSRIYRNDGGTFVDIVAGLTGVWEGSVAWGDYDNDGDLDILMCGATVQLPNYYGEITRIYRNDAGAFVDVQAALPATFAGDLAWGDYDNDGDLDILISGGQGDARIFRNTGGVFADIGAGLPRVAGGTVAWGDYDNDGDLDILLTGSMGAPGRITRVYRNQGGAFADIGAGLIGVFASAAVWGDYDNDGDLDIGLHGISSETVAALYRNDGSGVFVEINAGLPALSYGSMSWGDYDADGDLDLLMNGRDESGSVSYVYRSDNAPMNAPPASPSPISAQMTGNRATLSWASATDDRTPPDGLSYNLRIGTTPGGQEICAPMASLPDGYRRVAQWGNAQQRTSWSIELPPGPATYYWSVQAIDGAYAGSPFRDEQSFVSAYTITASAGPHGSIAPAGVTIVSPGGSQAYAITPDAFHHVAGVLVDGVSVGVVSGYTFANVQADHAIAASFAIDTHVITATADPGGRIVPSGVVVVDHAASRSFTITADPGWEISDVTVDGGTIGPVNGHTFVNVTEDHTIHATFTRLLPGVPGAGWRGLGGLAVLLGLLAIRVVRSGLRRTARPASSAR